MYRSTEGSKVREGSGLGDEGDENPQGERNLIRGTKNDFCRFPRDEADFNNRDQCRAAV